MNPAVLYLLDTNTASYLINGRSPTARRRYLETEPHARIAISAITQAELLFGIERRPAATRLRSNLEQFFEAAHLAPWDSPAARAYGKLMAELNAAGRSLSLMDMLIASHAIALGAILVTHDQAFQLLAPLVQVVDWSTDL